MVTKDHKPFPSFSYSLVFTSLVLIGVNVVFPLLTLLFTHNKQYAAIIFAVHVLPLYVQNMDRPFNLEVLFGFCTSLFLTALLLAILDRFIIGRIASLAIRSLLVVFCYAILLLGVLGIVISK